MSVDHRHRGAQVGPPKHVCVAVPAFVRVRSEYPATKRPTQYVQHFGVVPMGAYLQRGVAAMGGEYPPTNDEADAQAEFELIHGQNLHCFHTETRPCATCHTRVVGRLRATHDPHPEPAARRTTPAIQIATADSPGTATLQVRMRG